jgi:hypothetical protein
MNLTGSDVRVESMSPDPPKVRAVFDCMVFLQGAARRESAAGACLLLVELDAIEFCVSEKSWPKFATCWHDPGFDKGFPH